MIKQVLANFPYAMMPTAVMLLFIAFFASVVIWVYRRGSTEFYGKLENLPFDHEVENE